MKYVKRILQGLKQAASEGVKYPTNCLPTCYKSSP